MRCSALADCRSGACRRPEARGPESPGPPPPHCDVWLLHWRRGRLQCLRPMRSLPPNGDRALSQLSIKNVGRRTNELLSPIRELNAHLIDLICREPKQMRLPSGIPHYRGGSSALSEVIGVSAGHPTGTRKAKTRAIGRRRDKALRMSVELSCVGKVDDVIRQHRRAADVSKWSSARLERRHPCRKRLQLRTLQRHSGVRAR